MTGLAEAIQKLADPDGVAREAAASHLYDHGRALGEAATRAWRNDPELAALLQGPPTVGVAVWPEQFERIRAHMGSPRLAQVPPDQDAKEFELHFGPGVHLDILTTKAPGGNGAIARFLEKFGEGIQQVEYRTADVDRAIQLLRARFRLEPVYPETRPGADSARVNFFLVPTAEGKKVLIELVEESR